MKKIILNSILVLSMLTFLKACYPGDDVSIKDLDTVTTLYTASDFETPPNSAMIYWKVGQITAGDGDDIPYGGQIDDEILNTTLHNLVAIYGVDNVYIYSNTAQPVPTPSNGAVEVITANDPIPGVEATIVPSIVLRNKTSASVVYPPCLPGWWYWWCYPPIVSVSSYDVGTVILDMKEIANGTDGDPSWRAFMRGLLSSNENTNSTRTIESIDDAFAQSPYLN
ncbi:DUF4136 domain-containing protein [Urechidicola vernalis]|uniref:DUF4136 domain-containing protein n=1 Tax=Urechidicola vernalis TaxID=3075600 RepID=A0ABU2Y6N9_9FLAO|nr:DUF4136 domain-containing protein [Urechidicola sp. P050]MDT0553865.1 DUF4136 domain-containing protein [Urechidicola sp. P050]